MASILYSRVVGDLTVGKPKFTEFHQSRSVREALETLIELNDFELPVWRVSRKKSLEKFGANPERYETSAAKEERFVGMLSMVDIMRHLVSDSSLDDPIAALEVSVSEIMTADPTLVKLVASGTRLIDALTLINEGTRRLLVPLCPGSSRVSRGFCRSSFSSKWMISQNFELVLSRPDKPLGYCCLSVEDVARFLLSCLGALAPFPLNSIQSQGIINTSPPLIQCTDPAKNALRIWPKAPAHIQAVAVVQEVDEGRKLLVGEISAIRLVRCGFRVAMALAALSAADFAAYVEHFGDSTGISEDENLWSKSLTDVNYQLQYKGKGKYSSIRSRIMPLTCRSSNSVAAVMTQMLAYRTTHVWVTEEDGTLQGIVTYPDIMAALTSGSTPMDKLMATVIAKDIHSVIDS
ncbi:unnamed protein product [Calypogeia fissa]